MTRLCLRSSLLKKTRRDVDREADDAVVTTVVEYDSSQWRSAFAKHVLTSLVLGVLHIYFSATTPLVITLATTPYNFFASPLAQIYFVGIPASGALKRPFGKKQTTLMGDLRKQIAELSTDTSPPVAATPTVAAASTRKSKR